MDQSLPRRKEKTEICFAPVMNKEKEKEGQGEERKRKRVRIEERREEVAATEGEGEKATDVSLEEGREVEEINMEGMEGLRQHPELQKWLQAIKKHTEAWKKGEPECWEMF